MVIIILTGKQCEGLFPTIKLHHVTTMPYYVMNFQLGNLKLRTARLYIYIIIIS